MPQRQFLFSAIFVFQKSSTGNILGIAQDKNPTSYNSVTKPQPEGEKKGDTWRPDTRPARPRVWPRLACVWPHQVASDSALLPIYSPSQVNPRGAERNTRKVTAP